MGIQMKAVYYGKAKDLSLEELFLLLKFGRKTESIEGGDLCAN